MNAVYVIHRVLELQTGDRVRLPVATVDSEDEARRRVQETAQHMGQIVDRSGAREVLGEIGIASISHTVVGMEVQGPIQQVQRPGIVKPH